MVSGYHSFEVFYSRVIMLIFCSYDLITEYIVDLHSHFSGIAWYTIKSAFNCISCFSSYAEKISHCRR